MVEVPEVSEPVINVKLAEILSELGIDARSERVRGRRRPDIRCFYRGLIIGVEASYDRSDAERDAETRVEQGLVDIAIALHIKEKFRDVPEPELKELIKRSRFAAKVLVSREIKGALIQFIEKEISKKAEPATEWFEDVDIPTLKLIIESSAEFLLREEEVVKHLEEVKKKVSDFVSTLAGLDTRRDIRRGVYEILYRLYGLTIAETEDPEIAFGHAALSILLSTTFYEHIRSRHPNLLPLTDYVAKYGAIEGLRNALSDLLKIDYRVVVETTLNILRLLPPAMNLRVKDLVDLGVRLASNRSLLRRDFAGRLYHEITGDIALRKGFATFYTEVPAAYLLASLAVQSLLDLDTKNLLELAKEEARKIIDRIASLRVGDLACGSGTLLTASYSALMRIATTLKYYHDLEDVDLEALGGTLIENGIYGIDALRYASQITAINLALINPGTIARENVFTIYLGYIPEKNQAWLGSLELLNNTERVGGLLAWIEGGLRGVAERVGVEGTEGAFSIPRKFDMIIMNPPFTRPTYRGKEKMPEEKRAFFGFITDKIVREELRSRYSEVLERVSEELKRIAKISATNELSDLPSEIRELIESEEDEKLSQYLKIGLAGEALPFLYLAYKYIDNSGVIAFVLPRAVLAGVSWFLARVLLASKFHLKYVVVSADPQNGYNFSEGTSLSEALIVAKRVDKHEPREETVFVILTRKPKTMLEGIMLAEEVKRAVREGKLCASIGRGGASCIIRRVRRDELLKFLDNWSRFVAILDPVLHENITELYEHGEIRLGEISVRIPIIKLRNILKTIYVERKRGKKRVEVPVKSIGIDAHQFYELYIEAQHSPYPVFLGTEEEHRLTMRCKPNAYILFKSEDVKDRAISTFNAYAGRVLVPGVNIWWDTSHVIVMYCDQRILSNTHYAIRLNVREELEQYAEKALTLWFNTTWGLLTILVNREETRGRWAQIKMGQWLLMPVLNVSRLDPITLNKLAEIFDRYADKHLRRIPEQFDPRNPDPVRLSVDIEFLKVFNPKLDNDMLRRALLDLYRHVHESLRLWIGREDDESQSILRI